MIDGKEMVEALRKCSVQTGSLVCLGCGHEHNCSAHGCAILREAAGLLENYQSALDGLEKLNTRITKHNEELWRDYDAVCREKAQLLEDFRKSLLGDPCDFCEHMGEPTSCAEPDEEYLCDTCIDENCPCHDCRDCDKWTWRGAEGLDRG